MIWRTNHIYNVLILCYQTLHSDIFILTWKQDRNTYQFTSLPWRMSTWIEQQTEHMMIYCSQWKQFESFANHSKLLWSSQPSHSYSVFIFFCLASIYASSIHCMCFTHDHVWMFMIMSDNLKQYIRIYYSRTHYLCFHCLFCLLNCNFLTYISEIPTKHSYICIVYLHIILILYNLLKTTN